MTDVEVCMAETAGTGRDPGDTSIDDVAGLVEALDENTDVRRVLAVMVDDVAIDSARAVGLRAHGPLDREEPLPARHERRYRSGWGGVVRGDTTPRQDQGDQPDPRGRGHAHEHLGALLSYRCWGVHGGFGYFAAFDSSDASQPPPRAFTSSTLASIRRRRMSISARWFVRVAVCAMMTCR